MSRLKLQCQKLALPGNTYHWIQLAKWMEYWQKFSFITSFSKGLIGYSLRNSGEREAAVSMSGIVGWVERECREECRGRSWGPGKQENTSKKTLHLLRDPKVLTCNRLEVCFVLFLKKSSLPILFDSSIKKMPVQLEIRKIWVQNLFLMRGHS